MDEKNINLIIDLLSVSRNPENVVIAFLKGISPSDLNRLEKANIPVDVAASATKHGFTIDEICGFSNAKLFDLPHHLKNKNASREFFDRFGGNGYLKAKEAAKYYENYDTIEKIIACVSHRNETAEILHKMGITDEHIYIMAKAGCNFEDFAIVSSKIMDEMKNLFF